MNTDALRARLATLTHPRKPQRFDDTETAEWQAPTLEAVPIAGFDDSQTKDHFEPASMEPKKFPTMDAKTFSSLSVPGETKEE